MSFSSHMMGWVGGRGIGGNGRYSVFVDSFKPCGKNFHIQYHVIVMITSHIL